MHVLLALSFSLAVVHGCPISSICGESSRHTINSLINIAQTTLVRIKNLKMPMALNAESSTPSIVGLISICYDLGLLENDLQSPLTELIQIQVDVSSMEAVVRSLASTMNCPIPAKPRKGTIDRSFPDSDLYLSVMRLQRYLDTFLLNTDKLQVC